MRGGLPQPAPTAFIGSGRPWKRCWSRSLRLDWRRLCSRSFCFSWESRRAPFSNWCGVVRLRQLGSRFQEHAGTGGTSIADCPVRGSARPSRARGHRRRGRSRARGARGDSRCAAAWTDTCADRATGDGLGGRVRRRCVDRACRLAACGAGRQRDHQQSSPGLHRARHFQSSGGSDRCATRPV